MRPDAVYPDKTLLLTPAYYGSVSRYAVMARYGRVCIDVDGRFDKRFKAAHRMTVADVNGPMQLTLPVGKPVSMSQARWSDISLSSHGEWWHVHRVALESAYGRTPFFEFYIDRFLPFLNRDVPAAFRSLADIDMAIEREICSILYIPEPVAGGAPDDADRLLKTDSFDCRLIPYYQVRSAQFGFLPDLSVLDLIFNMGPEAALVIRDMSRGR